MKYPVMCSGGVATNGSGSPHGGISSAHSGAHSGNGGEKRKSSKHQSQGDSSPLDALFQMASKTFEGLKAKSGKTFFFRGSFFVLKYGHFLSDYWKNGFRFLASKRNLKRCT